MARGRGRRVRPLAAQARAADRGAHQRRARPPHDLRLAARRRRRRSARSWRWPSGRSCGTGRSCSRWRRPARRSTPFDVPAPELDGGGSRFDARRRRGRAGGPGRPQRPQRRRGADRLPARGRRPRRGRRRAGGLRAAPAGASSGSARPPRGALVVDDYAHHPTEVAATLEAARTLGAAPRRRRLPAAPVLAHARTRRASSAPRSPLADLVVVLDIYPARERAEDFPGVTGRLVAAAAADAAGGRPVAWLPGFDEAERLPARRRCATATCCSRSAPATSTRSAAALAGLSRHGQDPT